MNFPMIEDINKNTNAKAQETKDYMETVKEAILAALPEGGIEQSALDAAVEEIIAAMPSQTATAQTKKFTNVVQSTTATAKTITGCGLAYVKKTGENCVVEIDGVAVHGQMAKSDWWTFYFDKSLYICGKQYAEYISYIVMT